MIDNGGGRGPRKIGLLVPYLVLLLRLSGLAQLGIAHIAISPLLTKLPLGLTISFTSPMWSFELASPSAGA